MPLSKGFTPATVGKNIASELKSGRPKKMAIAIALSTARTSAKKSGKRLKGFLARRPKKTT